MKHVMMVCTGNMCRSPLAEAILKAEFERRGVGGFQVSSAGTGAWDGRAPSDGAMLVALEHGLDISEHRSRHLSRDLVEQADIIFTMARNHSGRAEKLGGDGRVFLLGEYAGKKRSKAEVADPYGEELHVYRDTFAQLQSLIHVAADRLIKERDEQDCGD
ncbi:low molecular weight protein arginine phosphatase [Gemmatimonadota bacterium]